MLSKNEWLSMKKCAGKKRANLLIIKEGKYCMIRYFLVN